MSAPLYKPGLKLGILGGGQLGRMLIQAAIDLDLEVHVMDPDPEAPACAIAHNFQCASLQDEHAILEFARPLDLITVEIENVNAVALHKLFNTGKTVRPEPAVLKVIQNKRLQKEFFIRNNLPTCPFQPIGSLQELKDTARYPCVQKLELAGYDGRGVCVLDSANDLERAFDAPSILEEKAAIKKEISVLISRNDHGELALYDPVELTYHKDNLVDTLLAPAQLSPALNEKARDLARRTAQAFGITGLLAVEMFVVDSEGGQDILINECAPRPHNSGHHTMKACQTSQFETHLRAILGLPPGNTALWNPAAMLNVLGKSNGQPDFAGAAALLAIPGASLHLYGKKQSRPGRKLGHIIAMAPTFAELESRIQQIKDMGL